jgi:two-component system NtrC family sensor kinase
MCCGQLAASVAHEINTPTHFVHYNIHFLQDAFTDLRRLLDSYEKLAAVAGSGAVTPIQIEELKALVEELDIDYLKDEIPQAIEQSLDGLQRITKIVQSMKEFSHPGTDEKALCDLNRAIESTIDVSRNE